MALGTLNLGRLATAAARHAVPKLIYDGDVGPDPCDFGELAMLHDLQHRHQVNVLAQMSTMPEKSNVEIMDIFNRWYGDHIPIGAYKGSYTQTMTNYSAMASRLFPASGTIAEHYASWHPQTFAKVPSSVTLYRKILSAQKDHSVTILTAGQLFNIAALLASRPDAYSRLDGMALVRTKVKSFVMMLGAYGKPMTASDLASYNRAYNNDGPNTYFGLVVYAESPRVSWRLGYLEPAPVGAGVST